jgi:single-strand DNA-binding protein
MFNRVIVIGNLTRDIELKYLPSGSAVAKSAIASTYKYKSSTGEQKEEVCFLDFNLFGRSAEVANQYLKKGSKVLLEGRLILEQWTAQDGTARSKHSLRVEAMKMLDSKPSGEQQDYRGNGHQEQGYQAESNTTRQNPPIVYENRIPEIDIDEEEIPF